MKAKATFSQNLFKTDGSLSPEDRFPLNLAAVNSHLERHGIVLDVSQSGERLSGGLSNLNYLVVANGRRAVLRRPPMGKLPPGAHDMVREHHVLSRLSRSFPQAPNSFFLCEDTSVIGVPFQLLEYREGMVVRGNQLPQSLDSAGSRHALSLELVSALAALHAIDTETVGLEQFGRPDGFFRRNVQGWLRRGAGATSDAEISARIERIGAWLSRQEPRPSMPTLLHSDFKLDNCMLRPDLTIGTVLDWDMSTRGDPLMDLATLSSYWTQPGDPECLHRLGQMPTASPGFMTRSDVVESYGALTGRSVDQFAIWRVLAMLKLGVVFLQLHRNWTQGIAGNEAYRGFAQLGADIIDYTLESLDRPI